MKHVLKDLLGRKLLTITLAVTLITMMASTGVHAGVLGALLGLGVFLLPPPTESATIHVLRALPIKSRAVGTAYWIFGVILFPAFYFFWSLLGEALISESGGVSSHGGTLQVLPRAAIALIGMGYSSVLFLLMPPNAMASSRGTFWEWLLAALWVCSVLPVIYLQETMLMGYREQAPWFYLALLASPIAMGAAYSIAPSSLRNASQRTKAQPLKCKEVQLHSPNSSIAFWARRAAESLLLAASYLAFILLIHRAVASTEVAETIPMFGIGLVIIAGVNLQLPLRALRVLPMSSLRLTFLLAALNSIAFVAAAIAVGVALLGTNQWALVWLAMSHLLYGFVLRLTSIPLMLRFGIGGFILRFLVFLIPIMILGAADESGYLGFALALMSVLAAIPLTKSFLEKSSEVYRTPKIYAMHR